MNLHIMKGKSIAVANNAADGVKCIRRTRSLLMQRLFSRRDVTITVGDAGAAHALWFRDR